MLSLARPIHVQPLLEFKTIAHTDVFAHACAPAPKLGEFTFELYVKLEKIGEITFELYVKLEKIASWCLPRWPRHGCFPLLYLSLCIVERFVGCTFAHAHTHTHRHVGAQSLSSEQIHLRTLALKVCLPNRYAYRTDIPTHVVDQSLSSEQIRILSRLSIKVCLPTLDTHTHVEQHISKWALGDCLP